jgi:hypothetical protein
MTEEKDKKVHLLYGHPDGLHYCQNPKAERFTTNIFKVTCEKCKQGETKEMRRLPEKEWEVECPFCKSADCEYEGTGDEFEEWICARCTAIIQVPFEIKRFAGVFACDSVDWK